jgi:hypothetical protein
MVTGVIPSVYVALQGAAPVNVKVIAADWPLQMVVVPLMEAVGRVFTVTAPLLIISAAIELHLLSLAAVSTYV